MQRSVFPFYPLASFFACFFFAGFAFFCCFLLSFFSAFFHFFCAFCVKPKRIIGTQGIAGLMLRTVERPGNICVLSWFFNLAWCKIYNLWISEGFKSSTLVDFDAWCSRRWVRFMIMTSVEGTEFLSREACADYSFLLVLTKSALCDKILL